MNIKEKKDKITINLTEEEINELLNNIEMLDYFDFDDDFEYNLLTIIGENDIPVSFFDKRENKLYYFETVIELGDEEDQDLENTIYFGSIQQEGLLLIKYKGQIFGCTSQFLYLGKTIQKFNLNDRDIVEFSNIFLQSGLFSFFYKKYKKINTEEMGRESLIIGLYNDFFKSFNGEAITVEGIYNYIKNNYSYSSYMIGHAGQKAFEKKAKEQPNDFFFFDYVLSKKCVCESFSELFAILCYFSGFEDVLVLYHKSSGDGINHFNNAVYDHLNDKYFHIDLTFGIFSEITQKEYEDKKKIAKNLEGNVCHL